MAATPYPTNLYHSDTAQALQLNAQVVIPPTGDMELVVAGSASAVGWPVIPADHKMVVTVARDTVYEKKYLISSITSGTYVSTLEILAADREYDGLQPSAAPAGATVEHTVSAVELATMNDHMQTKQTHGSDGDLVDEDSVQTLTNKTLTAPVITGLAAADANGEPVRYDEFVALPLMKAGGKMTGDLEIEKNAAWLVLDAAAGDLPAVMFQKGGVRAFGVEYNSATGLNITMYNPSTGAYIGSPLVVKATGQVQSNSHIGGETDVASGGTFVDLPASPTGNWAFTASGSGAGGIGIKTGKTTATRFAVYCLNVEGVGVAGHVWWTAVAF